ncbi:hypothetical protein ACF068_15420 [Streptomyces sp. NPDC016309]
MTAPTMTVTWPAREPGGRTVPRDAVTTARPGASVAVTGPSGGSA